MPRRKQVIINSIFTGNFGKLSQYFRKIFWFIVMQLMNYLVAQLQIDNGNKSHTCPNKFIQAGITQIAQIPASVLSAKSAAKKLKRLIKPI